MFCTCFFAFCRLVSCQNAIVNRKRRATSAQHIRDIALTQLKRIPNFFNMPKILSVSSDGQVLVGQEEDYQLHVYSTDGVYVASIDVPGGDSLRHAA